MAYIDFDRAAYDAESVRVAAGTFGGVGLADLERMSFARYTRVIEEVNRLWRKPSGGETEGDGSAE